MALEELVACNTSSEKLMLLLPEIIATLEEYWFKVASEWSPTVADMLDDGLINKLKEIQHGT